MPRQRRLHFHKGSDQRRKQLLNAVIELGPEIIHLRRVGRRQRQQRDAACRIWSPTWR
jgi:hypothetical protein